MVYIVSSLVGKIISKIGWFLNDFSCLNFSIIGSEKASVFPLPVLSLPTISEPLKI